MIYRELANNVLLEMISIDTWNKFSKPNSLIRKLNRGVRRGLQGTAINQHGIDKTLLGEKLSKMLNPDADRRIKGVKMIMKDRIKGNKEYYKIPAYSR